MTIGAFASGLWIASLATHVVSAGMAMVRCARAGAPLEAPADAPPVSIVQPLCGLEPYSRETLDSIFALDYPDYEILFCLADAADPIAPIANRAIAAHPERKASLLIGDDRVSANPKLNNVVKGWKAASHDWIVIADSNVLMPADYIQRLLRRWRADSGVVCSPPIGAEAQNFAAEIECAFLNTYQARWQYAGELAGFGFAQGKSMLWRRAILEAGGGVEALGAEIAEDAAASKLVRRAGLSAHLVDAPFQQPLGARRYADVWRRQTRWARLRRATFPAYFALEIVTTSLLALMAAGFAAAEVGVPPWLAVALTAIVWYGAEAALAKRAGWTLSVASPAAWMARDLLLPWLWLRAWFGNRIEWRGNAMSVAEPRLDEATAPR